LRQKNSISWAQTRLFSSLKASAQAIGTYLALTLNIKPGKWHARLKTQRKRLRRVSYSSTHRCVCDIVQRRRKMTTSHVLLALSDSPVWGWIVWIIIGGIAGWLAGLVVRGAGFGVIGDIIVGIIGALIGGFIFSAFGLGGGGFFWSFLVAFVGACILIFIVRLIAGGRTRGRTI
jgi:uncharacterized membrane protein YeaQ/YmgE (transglycosylase-associated protein family)